MRSKELKPNNHGPERQAGFNIIELMTVILLVGILTAVAVPSFYQVILNNQMATATNTIVGVLNFARAEAVRRGRPVHVGSVRQGVDAALTGVDWVVWVDDSGAPGSLDNDDWEAGEEIRVWEPLKSSITVNLANNNSYLVFNAEGIVSGAKTSTLSEAISLCDERASELGNKIELLVSGSTVLGKNDATDC